MSALLSVFGFIVMLGLLIFIHELGHFLAAKLFGVRVDVFSLGFVGRVVSFRWGETRYQIGWLPLGGYVKMFGDQEHVDLPRELQLRAFVHKPLWQRAIIVLAGPLANIVVLPLLALGTIYMLQQSELSTVIGSVVPGMPAARAGLRPGDRIDAVSGYKTRYFRDLLYAIGRSANKPLELLVTRDKKRLKVKLKPVLDEQKDPFGGVVRRGMIGITADYRKSEIGISDPKSPAYRAGLRTWDNIVAVDGRPIRRWEELLEYRQKNPAGPHRYTYRRTFLYEGPVMQIRHALEPRTAVVYPKAVRGEDGKVHYVDGIHSSELFVRRVLSGSPLAKAGLRANDRLISMVGKKLRIQSDLSSLPDISEKKFPLVFERAGKQRKIAFRLFSMKYVDPLNQRHDRVLLGVQMSSPYARGIEVPIVNRFSYATQRASEETWFFSGLLVKVIKKLFTREISTDNIGGPIMIFQIAQEAVKSGWEVFLRHLALISINLGLINLLPIPLLDGGHLFFFLIEAVIRRPIPQRLKESALLLGLVMLLFLLLLAVKNDLQRIFAG